MTNPKAVAAELQGKRCGDCYRFWNETGAAPGKCPRWEDDFLVSGVSRICPEFVPLRNRPEHDKCTMKKEGW